MISSVVPAKPVELLSAVVVPSVRYLAPPPMSHVPYKETAAAPSAYRPSYRPHYSCYQQQTTDDDLTMNNSSENKATHLHKMWNKGSFSAITQHSSHIATDTGHHIRDKNATTTSLRTYDPANGAKESAHVKSVDAFSHQTPAGPSEQGHMFCNFNCIFVLFFSHE